MGFVYHITLMVQGCIKFMYMYITSEKSWFAKSFSNALAFFCSTYRQQFLRYHNDVYGTLMCCCPRMSTIENGLVWTSFSTTSYIRSYFEKPSYEYLYVKQSDVRYLIANYSPLCFFVFLSFCKLYLKKFYVDLIVCSYLK